MPRKLTDAEKLARRGSVAATKQDRFRQKKRAEQAERAAAVRNGLGLERVGPPPSDLNELERQCWKDLEAQVDVLRIHTPADRSAFRLLVLAYARLERCRTDRKTSAAAFSATVRTAGVMLGRFGLDPSSRDKLAPISAPVDKREADPDHFRPITLRVVQP